MPSDTHPLSAATRGRRAADTADTADAEHAAPSPVERYRRVRRFTETLCEPLEVEDYVIQTMEDVSPTKWHLAHVSWFFETFLLQPYLTDYRSPDSAYAYLFNSYYIQAGERHCRGRRGWISRPTVAEVRDYRAYIDDRMEALLEDADEAALREILPLLELGLNHEQQHQELLLTDIKHVFSVNPLRPAYRAGDAGAGADSAAGGGAGPLGWVEFDEGLYEVGHAGDGFAYDNERPRHRHYLEGFRLADRLVTNGEYLQFMRDAGYRRPELWLSDGWARVEEHDWSEPFYWERTDAGGGEWSTFTLAGVRELDPDAPVCHVGYFEADAFARWAGARLPTEQEWEVAARGEPVGAGNFVETGRHHPAPAPAARQAGAGRLRQLYGDVWEWTRSQYSPYPGYAPPSGAIGEYNGKFMCNQFVLRGGSCATARSHIRPTYRNFFPPEACWQFTGIRLAADAS